MMKRLILFLLIVFIVSGLAKAQDVDVQHVDTVAVDDDDMLLPEERAAMNAPIINATIAGEWCYNKPSVQARGTSFVGKLGKPIAKSKLKKKLDKAFKKLKIGKRWNSLTLSPDGQWALDVVGMKMKGKYTYDPAAGQLTLKWHGVPLRSVVKRDGKRMHLLFDTDHLLSLLRIIGGFSSSETLKALSFLSDNFDDVMVGFELKQK